MSICYVSSSNSQNCMETHCRQTKSVMVSTMIDHLSVVLALETYHRISTSPMPALQSQSSQIARSYQPNQQVLSQVSERRYRHGKRSNLKDTQSSQIRSPCHHRMRIHNNKLKFTDSATNIKREDTIEQADGRVTYNIISVVVIFVGTIMMTSSR
jgi:hypothetical protein